MIAGIVLIAVAVGYTALVMVELSLLGTIGLIPALAPWIIAFLVAADCA